MTNLSDASRRLSLLRRFLHRTDVIAIWAPWGRPCPAAPVGNIDEVLLAHLHVGPPVQVTASGKPQTGRFRVGSYCVSKDQTVIWICTDFDGPGHSWVLEDPLAAALKCLRAYAAAGLSAYLERSGSGNGWHVWCFFSEPITAGRGRALAHLLVPKDARLVDGQLAAPIAGHGIEIFPKQDTISDGGLGHQVWLPFWGKAPAGANTFYREDGSAELQQYLPDDFQTASPGDVERVLRTWGGGQPKEEHRTSDWSEWRALALGQLRLESVYGEWLTGKHKSKGWLECRDPDSPTGDKHPSAGVADGQGEAERGTFHSFIGGKTLSVFDFLVERGRAATFIDACKVIADLSGTPMPDPASKRDVTADQEHYSRPEIRITPEEWQVNDDAVAALENDESLFERDGLLVHVVREPLPEATAPKPSIRRAPESPRIVLASPAFLRERLSERILWMKHDKRTGEWEHAHPPSWAVNGIFARGHWPTLRRLVGVTESPVLRTDGSILDSPGYDAATGLLYHPNGQFLSVPASPSRYDALQAMTELKEVVCDFPFAKDEHRSTWLAALLTPIARQAFDGCAPLFLFDANVSGSGKSLLTDIIATIVLGRNMARMSATDDDEEMRKRITTMAIAGDPIVLIDNIENGGYLGCPTLDMALTADEYRDRLLGQNAELRTRLRMIWFATGNNVQLRGDMQRRVLHARIESSLERPTERTGFRHSPLIPWVLSQRPRLLRAALTVLRAHAVAGRPCADTIPALGSYEAWSAAVRAPLAWLGEADPALTQRELAATADNDVALLAELIEGWAEMDPDNYGMTVRQAVQRLEQNPKVFHVARSSLEELCPPRGGKPATSISIGKKLQKFKGRFVAGRALDHVGYDEHLKAVRWGIRCAT